MARVWLSLGVCIFAIVLLLAAWKVRERDLEKIHEIAVSTNAALCTFRSDLQRRADATEEFIERHPEGIPGISRQDLVRSWKSQQATLQALDSLKCKQEVNT